MSQTRKPFVKRGSTAIGVDIGTTSIKIAEVANLHGSPELVGIATAGTPIDSVKEGTIVDTAAVADAIRKMWRDAGFRSREVSCGISGQDVVVRPVAFPHMPYEELKEAIKWEADKYLPFPADDAVIDVVMPDQTALQQDATSDVEVMLVAALKSKVESYAAAIEQAGLTPIAVDIQPFCMMRAYGLNGTDETGSVAYIDIGGGTTDLVICNGEHLRMTRIVQIGGSHFTDVVMKTMELPLMEAESFKISSAEVMSGEEEYSLVTDGRRKALLEGLFDVAQGLCLECKRSITYHDAQLQGKVENLSVKEIVLAGGGSKLKGLDEMLAMVTGLPVSFGETYRRVSIPSRTIGGLDVDSVAPIMPVAIGLALRGVEEE